MDISIKEVLAAFLELFILLSKITGAGVAFLYAVLLFSQGFEKFDLNNFLVVLGLLLALNIFLTLLMYAAYFFNRDEE